MFYKNNSPSKMISKLNELGQPKLEESPKEMNEILVGSPASKSVKSSPILKSAKSNESNYKSCESSLSPSRKTVTWSDVSSGGSKKKEGLAAKNTVTRKSSKAPRKLRINKAKHPIATTPTRPVVKVQRVPSARKRLFRTSSAESLKSDETQTNSPALSPRNLFGAELDVHVSMSPSVPLIPGSGSSSAHSRVSLAETEDTVYMPPDQSKSPNAKQLLNICEVLPATDSLDGHLSSGDDENDTEEQLWTAKLSVRHRRRNPILSPDRVRFPSSQAFHEYSNEFAGHLEDSCETHLSSGDDECVDSQTTSTSKIQASDDCEEQLWTSKLSVRRHRRNTVISPDRVQFSSAQAFHEYSNGQLEDENEINFALENLNL